MKNKMIKITLLLLIGLFYTNNVYATATTITTGDYEFLYEGVKLKVYQLDASNMEEVTETDEENGTTTYTTSPDIENYFKGIPTKTIDLPLLESNTIPFIKNDIINEERTTFIGLNEIENITKQGIESLLSEEYESVSETMQYLVEVVAQVKVVGVPDGVTKIEKNNIIKGLLGVFYNTGANNIDIDNTISLNTTTDIIMSTISIGINDETNQKEFIYTDDEPDQLYYYLDLISVEFDNHENDQIFSINNLTEEQTDDLIEMLKRMNSSSNPDTDSDIISDIINGNQNTNNSNNNQQEVKVPNTGETIEKYKYIISIGVLGLGFLLIYKNTKKKKA